MRRGPSWPLKHTRRASMCLQKPSVHHPTRVSTEGKSRHNPRRERSTMPSVFNQFWNPWSREGFVSCSVSKLRGKRTSTRQQQQQQQQHQEKPLTRIKSLITLMTSSRVDHSSPTTARRSVFDPCAIFCTQLPDTHERRESKRGSR